MSTGQVKWFNNAKGFGFILPDDKGDDLFAHYSSIAMEGYKTLKAGQIVSFDVIEGPKGLHAANILATGKIADEGSVENSSDGTDEESTEGSQESAPDVQANANEETAAEDDPETATEEVTDTDGAEDDADTDGPIEVEDADDASDTVEESQENDADKAS